MTSHCARRSIPKVFSALSIEPPLHPTMILAMVKDMTEESLGPKQGILDKPETSDLTMCALTRQAKEFSKGVSIQGRAKSLSKTFCTEKFSAHL
jgi:hypothetical protein